MVPWSSTDNIAAQETVDLDIAANRARVPVSVIFVDFGEDRGRRYYNNQRNL
jgi:hypothetical protein